jgi:RHS repeat-associated protein
MCSSGACESDLANEVDPPDSTVSSVAPAESLYAMSVRLVPNGETPAQVGADFDNAMVVPRTAMEHAVDTRGYDAPTPATISEASSIAGLSNDPAVLGVQAQLHDQGSGHFVTVSSDVFIVIDDIMVRETGDGFVEGSDFSVVVAQNMTLRTPWYGTAPKLLMVEDRMAGSHSCCDTEFVDKKCKVNDDPCPEFPPTCSGPLGDCAPPGLESHNEALLDSLSLIAGDGHAEPFRTGFGPLPDTCNKGNGQPSVGLYIADPRATGLTAGNLMMPAIECEICQAVTCPADPLDPPPDSTPPTGCGGSEVDPGCYAVQYELGFDVGSSGLACDDQRGPGNFEKCKNPFAFGGLQQYSSSTQGLNPCGGSALPAYCLWATWPPGQAPAECTNGGTDPASVLFEEARLRMAGLLSCSGALPSSADPYAGDPDYTCCGEQGKDACRCFDTGSGRSICRQCNANGDCTEYSTYDSSVGFQGPDGQDSQDVNCEDTPGASGCPQANDPGNHPSDTEEPATPDVTVAEPAESYELPPDLTNIGGVSVRTCAYGPSPDGSCSKDGTKPLDPGPIEDPDDVLDDLNRRLADGVFGRLEESLEGNSGQTPAATNSNGPEMQGNGGSPQDTKADPIVLASGGMWIRSTDVEFAGVGDALRFERQYSSRSNHRGILGSNWKHNYEYRIKPLRRSGIDSWTSRFLVDHVLETQAVQLEMPDGSIRVFYLDAVSTAQLNVDIFLPQAGAFGHVVFRQGTWTWRDVDGSVVLFNEYGHPTSIRDRFGKGVTIEYEPVPMYVLYRRYCAANASEFYREQLDTRVCQTLGRVFDPHTSQSVGLEGWGDPNDPFPEDMNIELPYENLETIEMVNSDLYSDVTLVDQRWEVLAELVDFRSYAQWWFDLGVFPGLPTGSVRQRPVAVVDDLGRRLEFTYHGSSVREDEGLLESITGPAGVRVEYDYDAPATQDPRVNERYLVQVSRADTAPSQTGKMTGVVAAPDRTTTYTYAWPSSGFASFDGSGAAGAFTDRVRSSYLEYYSHTNGCQLTSGGVTEVCFGSGSVCSATDQCSGGAQAGETCFLTTGKLEGNPCFMAADAEARYVSAVADNVVRVTHDGVIESETAYGVDPDGMDFDRATHQRYGGLPLSEYTQPVAARVTGAGFVSDYPDYVLEYAVSGPETGINGDMTDALLPAALIARFPLESDEVTPPDPTDTVDPVGDCATAPEQSLIDAYDPVCDMSTFELTNRQQAYCDLNQGYIDAKEQLPGYVPQRPYYTSNSLSGDTQDRLWRSRVSCNTLATYHVSDPSHNGVISRAHHVNGTFSHYGVEASMRAQVAQDLRRICAWTKTTDRDGDVTYYGINFRGQQLVTATKKRGSTDYTVTETLYNADGKVRQERDPTLASADWQVGDGHTVYTYDEVEFSGQASGDHLEPWWWNRRGSLLKVEEYPGPGGALAHEWTTGSTLGAGEVIEKRVTNYEYESLFQLVRLVRSSVVVGGVTHDLRQVVHDYAYQELSLDELERRASGMISLGFPYYVIHAQEGAAASVYAETIREMFQVPTYGDQTTGLDINGDGKIGVVFDDSDPDHIGPIQGALVRTSILDMTGAQPEVERSILLHPGLAGQTTALIEPERSYMEFAFFESDGVGGGLGPDDAEATALASRYEYGLMARAMLKRYSTDLPDDIDVLDPQGNATTLTSCDHLPGSYRWMLPGGCAGDSFQQAYDRLEDELGLEAELVDRIKLMADANTDDDYRTYKFAYNELGQIYLSISDGERTSFVHDTDGRLLSRTEHYPVGAGASTAGAPIRSVTTYGRTLKGRVGYVRVEGGSGQLLSESFAQYDDEGNPLAGCVQVEVGAQCATALGAGSGCGGANTVLGARACAQAIDTAPPVPLHVSRDVDDPAYLLTTMRHTAEGQLAERKTPGTAHEEFEYDEFGRMTSYERSGSGGGNEQLRHTYDVRGRRTQTTIGPVSGPNLTRQYFYDGYDRLVRELDERGVNHHFAYDRIGYVSASKVGTSAYGSSNPAPSSGLESLWRYDVTGRLVAASNGGGESKRSYSYAPGDTRPVAISQTGRGTRWMTYDGSGRQVWSMDGEGNQRVFLDDPKTHAVGQALVRKSSVPTDTYLSETTVAYAQDSDTDERRIIRFGHEGGLVHASLVRRDGLGRVVMSVRPDGTKTELTYDLTGMPVTVAEESETGTDSISKVYDAFGNVIDVYEPVVGERTSYEYDGLGRLEATYLPMAPLEPMREYDYDELGRVSRRTLRTGPGTYEFLDSSYDSSGDLTALVWDDNLGGGERTLQEYTWDDARRLTSSTHHNLKLADMGFTGTQSTITRTYDGLNRLTSETFGNLGTTLPVTSTHWISGGPSLDSTIWTRTVESPSTRKWHRRQDKIGRVDEITVIQKVTHVATHELDWMGGLLEGRTVDFGQAGVDDFRYLAEHDHLGRVEHLAYRAVSLIDPDTPEDTQWGQDYCANGSWHHDPCAAPLFEVDVRHDVLGQIVATRRRFAQPLRVGGTLVDLASRPWPFRGYDHSKQGFLQKEWLYDSVDETKFDNNLSSHHINQDNLNYVTGGATGQTWNWVRASKVGSLESIELDTDPNTIRFAASTRLAGHRLDDVSLDTGPNSADFTVEHDGQGRVIFDGRYRYVWNVLGELVLAYDAQTTNPSAANYVEAYVYDTSSRLSQVRTDGAGIQVFVHDGDQKLGSYILKKSAVPMWEATWGVGIDDLIGFRDDAGEYEVLTDERHSPVALWNHTGLELVAMGDYDANGRMSTQPPDMSGGGCVEVGLFGTPCLLMTNATEMPFAFNGAWKSSVTGMSQMRFRWYSPTLGQFVSHDPLGSIDSYNLYSFARFGPNTRWDPWGLSGKDLGSGLCDRLLGGDPSCGFVDGLSKAARKRADDFVDGIDECVGSPYQCAKERVDSTVDCVSNGIECVEDAAKGAYDSANEALDELDDIRRRIENHCYSVGTSRDAGKCREALDDAGKLTGQSLPTPDGALRLLNGKKKGKKDDKKKRRNDMSSNREKAEKAKADREDKEREQREARRDQTDRLDADHDSIVDDAVKRREITDQNAENIRTLRARLAQEMRDGVKGSKERYEQVVRDIQRLQDLGVLDDYAKPFKGAPTK